MELHRLENENEEQFIFRLGQAKDSGTLDMSWDELADIINKEFRESEDEYRTEAAYRKPYQYIRNFINAGAIKQYESEDKYFEELALKKQELQKEKQKLSDERTALKKILREDARGEANLEVLEKMIKENGRTTLPPIVCKNYNENDNTLFVCISDVHMGMTFNNDFGKYNSDIAVQRMNQYLDEVLKLKDLYKADSVYVCLIGDLISGRIHITTQLENRENVIQQVQKVSELISSFVYELSKHFNLVEVNSVGGNHSRIGLKDDVLRDERLDDLVLWYMGAKLCHLDNVVFCDDLNTDPTIANCFVCGKEYVAVHGDYDAYSESGVSKLILMTRVIPEGIFYGHLHHNSYDNIAGVKIIRSGSFCGCGDDYTTSKRISGKPEQVVCVMDKNGIKAFCPITFD